MVERIAAREVDPYTAADALVQRACGEPAAMDGRAARPRDAAARGRAGRSRRP
jgi:hypothetical protein